MFSSMLLRSFLFGSLLYIVLAASEPSFTNAINRGLVDHGSIPEGSGLAASRRHPGILYTHNDHGGKNKIFALDATNARLRATFTISGATNHDWEDIAVGTCGQETCIYIGDIGDGGPQPHTIYRVKEPRDIRDQSLPVESKLLYEFSEKDCETLMIDPQGELYIASKTDDEPSWIAHVPTNGNWGTGTVVKVHRQAKFPFYTSKKNPVGGDISPDGTEMLIKFKEWVLYYKLASGESYVDAIKRDPLKLPYHPEPRGESVCWSRNADGYYTMSEGEGEDQPLYFYQRK
ncbi:uncharacterized protein LOC135463489 [Liolophura sinensis]|uniref:uncharacterized protein LOC135463489 n=1 Tax=Liolophura sinensis TaxID=3198878 RepID=UPI00315872F5